MQLEGVWFNQEGVRFFGSAMRAEDLLAHAQVDVYREENGSFLGYQRNPERARARAFARYLRTQSVPVVPTAVLLNARDGLSTGDSNGASHADIRDDADLWVIDGQHRIEGFRYAIDELGLIRLKDFPIPVVVADGLTMAQEAEQFRVINETAKKVRTDLARRLLAFAARSREGRQQIRAQQRLWEAAAAEVIGMLNTDVESALYGRIQAPNEKKGARHTVRELSFSTSLRPILTTFPYQDWGPRKIADQLSDYWQAWKAVVPEAFDTAEDYVMLRTPGIFSLHLVALYVWEVCRRRNVEPTVGAVTDMLQELEDPATAAYWENENVEGAAVFGSMKGFSMLADLIKDELFEKGYTLE